MALSQTTPHEQTPIVTGMRVIPVAGHDSMLLNLSGAHAPFFTRNLVLLTDNAGHTGVGEVPGGEKIRRVLEESRPLVVGQTDWPRTTRSWTPCGRDLPIATAKAAGSRHSICGRRCTLVTAIESAMLDLLGQFLACQLPRFWAKASSVPASKCSAICSSLAIDEKTNLPYRSESNASDAWLRLRHEEALTTEAIAAPGGGSACALRIQRLQTQRRRAGRRAGDGERSPHWPSAFPTRASRSIPMEHGRWRRLCGSAPASRHVLAYAEDPCGAEHGFSGREIMAEFRRATGLPTATNMVATDWRELKHAVQLNAIDIPLADPHFWTMQGSVRVAQFCREWGLTWGSHSNNHFDISLAMFTHVAAAAPGKVTAIDTHWIWQDGQRLTKDPLQIVDGKISVPDRPGLGIEVDMEQIERAHALYNTMGLGARDDAQAMQFLVPGWKFNPKRPCLIS